MKTVHDPSDMQSLARCYRRQGAKVGFVPTMGSLHEGHLSLVRRARRLADCVVVSIFVNPIQFGPGEDFEQYPRDAKRDATLLSDEGVDLLFMPRAAEMYATDASVFLDEDDLSRGLCGAKRPGHFRGVLTVVCKLFMLVQPSVAVFGRKDAQQAALIQQMVRDLNIPVEIDVVPIVRERDGLAMSSRNVFLSAEERRHALVIWQTLRDVRKRFRGGETDAGAACRLLVDRMRAAGGVVDYACCVDASMLKPVEQLRDNVLVAVACTFGRTRLIDNTVLGLPDALDAR